MKMTKETVRLVVFGLWSFWMIALFWLPGREKKSKWDELPAWAKAIMLTGPLWAIYLAKWFAK